MRILFFIAALQIAASLSAQTRYLDSLFAVEKSTDILYGSNLNYDGTSEDLFLDVYQPTDDTLNMRPLIILAHGGSFLSGSKENPSMVTLCNSFAAKGYVTASINYRLGVNFFEVIAGNGEEEFSYATLRGTHDLRAAIRFFRKDVADGDNTYGIDTSMIIAGGSSAGGFMALHAAYLDRLEEIPEEITNIEELGGIEGNSGNDGYSSEIDMAVNLCGAIGDTAWIEQGDTSLVSMHGTEDQTVPYGTGDVELFDVPVGEVNGSGVIEEKTNASGVAHDFYPFYGADHVPYDPIAGDTEHEAYMDTTINFVKTALYNKFFGQVTSTKPPVNSELFNVYPNPVRGERIWISADPEQVEEIVVTNLKGITIQRIQQVKHKQVLHLEPGFYLFNIITDENRMHSRKVIVY